MQVDGQRMFTRAWAARVLLLVALTAAGQCGCAVAQESLRPGVEPQSVVFVADGAGNFQAASGHLRYVVHADGRPIDVRTFEWSHGDGRIVADQVDFAHARAEGQALAEVLRAFHAEHPDLPLHLFGHSAGSAVALAAAEAVPPGVIDRVVLIAPALSAGYDIVPALRNVGGLHVFYSPHDWWYLGVYTQLIGTSDRRWGAASGRVGFQPSVDEAEVHLLDKLYQRPWHPADRFLGNFGGHYGNYQPGFVRTYILPLFSDEQG
jgi:pimeloyl-ACP methyl ester carboxylesterase